MKRIMIILTIAIGLSSCNNKSSLEIEDGIYIMNNNRTGHQVNFMNCLESDCKTFIDSNPYLGLDKLMFEIDEKHEFMDMLWYSMETKFPPVKMSDFEAKHDFEGISYFVLVLDGQAINYEPVIDSMVDVSFSVALQDWKKEDLKYLEKKLKK